MKLLKPNTEAPNAVNRANRTAQPRGTIASARKTVPNSIEDPRQELKRVKGDGDRPHDEQERERHHEDDLHDDQPDQQDNGRDRETRW